MTKDRLMFGMETKEYYISMDTNLTFRDAMISSGNRLVTFAAHFNTLSKDTLVWVLERRSEINEKVENIKVNYDQA